MALKALLNCWIKLKIADRGFFMIRANSKNNYKFRKVYSDFPPFAHSTRSRLDLPTNFGFLIVELSVQSASHPLPSCLAQPRLPSPQPPLPHIYITPCFFSSGASWPQLIFSTSKFSTIQLRLGIRSNLKSLMMCVRLSRKVSPVIRLLRSYNFPQQYS